MKRILRTFWLLPGLIVVIAAAIMGATYNNSDSIWVFPTAFAVTVVSFFTDGVLREIRPWARHEVYSILEGLHAAADLEKDERLCVYVPNLLRKDHVHQMTPYAPTRRYGSRKWGLNRGKGIVGYVFRNNENAVEFFDNNEDFETKMRENWGFTEDEIGKMRRDRRAYACVPILDADEKTKAVVYLDSPRIGTVTNEVVQQMQRAAFRIAELI